MISVRTKEEEESLDEDEKEGQTLEKENEERINQIWKLGSWNNQEKESEFTEGRVLCGLNQYSAWSPQWWCHWGEKNGVIWKNPIQQAL